MTRKDKVQNILDGFGSIAKKIQKKNKNKLNFQQLTETKEIKDQLQLLKDLDITGEWLFKNGFVAAGLSIGKYLN